MENPYRNQNPGFERSAHDQQQTDNQSADDHPPTRVRAALHLKPGDELVYEIVDNRVILTKARTSGRTDDSFRIFHEWRTEAAAKAYAEL